MLAEAAEQIALWPILRATNVNPIELDLYFERFINPYQNDISQF